MKRARRYLLIGGVVALVLLIAGFIIAGIFGVLLDVLYIALIILAFFSLISTAVLIYALLMLIGTISTVRNEMKPLIDSVQETVGVVRGSVQETMDTVKETAKSAGRTANAIGSTARLTREFAIGPSVRLVALIVAGQQILRVFLGRGHARKRLEERRQEQMELLNAAGGGE